MRETIQDQPTKRPIRRQKHGIDAVVMYTTVPSADRARLRDLAARENTTLSALVSRAIRLYLTIEERTS